MILKILMGILWLVVIPFGLGILPCRLLQKKYRSPGMIFAVGYLIMMALFECEYLPALFLKANFTTLCLIFRISVGFLSLVSTILGAKGLKDLSFPKWNAFMVIFVIMVGLQCAARCFQGVTDGDDAFFLGTAVTTYFSNKMYLFDPYTGFVTGLDVRHALSPGGIFIAYLYGLCGTAAGSRMIDAVFCVTADIAVLFTFFIHSFHLRNLLCHVSDGTAIPYPYIRCFVSSVRLRSTQEETKESSFHVYFFSPPYFYAK